MRLKLLLAIVGANFVLAGIVFTPVGIVWWLNVRHFVQTAEQTEGTVIELVKNRSKEGGSSYCPVVEYTDHLGQRHEHRANVSSNPPHFSVGDKVQILYDQNNPDSAMINHWLYLYFSSVLFVFLGAVSLVTAIAWFVVLPVFLVRHKSKGERPTAPVFSSQS